MVETDWREILSYSHRELMEADKEKLCESLSWMEADDIELNFTDLKTLFRLAQDILKYKNEQVNNLLGQLETSQRKNGKLKHKNTFVDSPTRSTESVLETITHQEEVIKANKEILEQLYADISEIRGQKNKLEEDKNNVDKESESSRDALSEMNAVTELENEITMKNRHIRKLLTDVKILEEENTKLKEKVSVLKDKLTEATQLIENLTEQLFAINNEYTRLKDVFAKSEQAKAQLSVEIESLRKELFEKDSSRENIYEEIKSKVQHWKNSARSKKAEIEALSLENTKLKEDLIQASKQSPSPKRNLPEEQKIIELQEKLTEASKEILDSAKIIELLKAENRLLKTAEYTSDCSVIDTKNESDDGKERTIINRLKRKNKTLVAALRGAEEMVADREKELTEITSQLQLLQSDESIATLLESLKNKKRQLKFKDEGIKSLVLEVNTLNQIVNDLELENESLRQTFNIPCDEKIPTKGILKKYRNMEQLQLEITKELKRTENKLLSVELENRAMNKKISKLIKLLNDSNCRKDKINEVCESNESEDEEIPVDVGREDLALLSKETHKETTEEENAVQQEEFQAIIEENAGLRKGLQEILDFLKDNSKSSSGVLALKCPSLEAVLQSMEARHSAGWFAPHMATILELRAALGGRDALLTALHEARKETFDVMTKLSRESQKSLELEHKLQEVERNSKTERETKENIFNVNIGEFGTWISDKDQKDIDFYDKNEIQNFLANGNSRYEYQLRIGLAYFYSKFKILFDKMTSLSIQAADNQNNWSLQEEQYKAHIENLRAQLCHNEEDDASESSPGLVSIPCVSSLQRKCSFLEESYKYIRTLNENLKNDYLENKRYTLLLTSDYENQIQKFVLTIANLTDKLRNSISIDLFWKQNEALNETVLKYRQLLEVNVKKEDDSCNLLKRLEDNRIDIINTLKKQMFHNSNENTEGELKTNVSHIEHSLVLEQLQQICTELDEKNKLIEVIENKNRQYQESQAKIIDQTLSATTKEEIELMRDQLQKLAEDNKVLKEQCRQIEDRLDINLLQLQDSQQRQLNNDMEINMLRHQILDLQSTSDNKAVIARLSNEVLVAHLQSLESHKKIEKLATALNKEKQMRAEVEEMLNARQKIFDVYAYKYESKFRYMYEVMEILRQQYEGCLPLISVENYLNKTEDLSRKTHAVNEKLNEIEDLQSVLMIKHSVFEQILDVTKNKCLEEQDTCHHKLKSLVTQGIQSRELDHHKKKLITLEQSRDEMLKHCSDIEKTLVQISQGFGVSSIGNLLERKYFDVKVVPNLELDDIQSDDETNSRRSQTITLPKPQLLKASRSNVDMSNVQKDGADILPGSPVKIHNNENITEFVNVFVQTCPFETQKKHKLVQTGEDLTIKELKHQINDLRENNNRKNEELAKFIALDHQYTEDIFSLKREKANLESVIQNLKDSIQQKDNFNERLRNNVEDLRKKLEDFKILQMAEINKTRDSTREENKSLLQALKQVENDKNSIVEEYKELFSKEREEYSNTVKNLNFKISELHSQLERRRSDAHASNGEAIKEVVKEYVLKNTQLEDNCFKLQNDLDEYKAKLSTYKSEIERWKNLASERLNKMEQLSLQLEERHSHEVESYKAENQHWLTQLNETQREHMELRSRLTEQKTLHIKQLADKDAQIEQLRSVVHNLKTQIMNMQTVMSVNDPSFDLSAIVEVDEASDVGSHQGSDKLEIKFDSSVDMHDIQDEIIRMPATSTTIWQESIIERLRREKQTLGKQNAILRRQVKVLASRERRARLDAQNLKNQVYRISTSGSKTTTAETAALHNKIASLHGQLASARRETHSSIALWDKWKRSQQSSERWQARYEENCQDVRKLEASLNLAKSTVVRLEKEKRVLLSRLAELKSENQLAVEKQDGEYTEKCVRCKSVSAREEEPPVSARALLDRVQAQQRRIVALEIAEKGNEVLVAEYEKALAEVTALKGQVLKLESTLLESQIRSPARNAQDPQPELQHWKSYCQMLKEENVQLTLRVNSTENTTPATAHRQRIIDLEQTVLTLRGLVSKLQAEQKTSAMHKRYDCRPSSAHSLTDKGRSQAVKPESYRIEIANLKRSIQDKDCLLERSKEMLKIAAEREEELLRENEFLRRHLDELTRPKGGFLSA